MNESPKKTLHWSSTCLQWSSVQLYPCRRGTMAGRCGGALVVVVPPLPLPVYRTGNQCIWANMYPRAWTLRTSLPWCCMGPQLLVKEYCKTFKFEPEPLRFNIWNCYNFFLALERILKRIQNNKKKWFYGWFEPFVLYVQKRNNCFKGVQGMVLEIFNISYTKIYHL